MTDSTGWVVAQSDGDHSILVRWDDDRLTVAHLDRRYPRLRIVTRPPADLFRLRDSEHHRQRMPRPRVRTVRGWDAIESELDPTTTSML